MSVLLLVAIALLMASVGWTAYRLGKEDGWLEGVAWAIREDQRAYPPLSEEFHEAKRGSRYAQVDTTLSAYGQAEEREASRGEQ